MTSYLVVTVIGADRPGLVEALAQVVARHEGNWLESRMAHLAGKFAGILRVGVPASKAEALAQELAGLPELKVIAEPAGAPEEMLRPLRLELLGTDHPGIVRDLSAALAKHRVNVEELETECTDAPMSGQALFKATARLHVPDDVRVEDLQRDLEALAQDLMVELSLARVESD